MERSLYSYEYVHLPFDEVVDLLSQSPELLFQPATDEAHEQTRQFVERLHVDVQGFELGRDVVVQLGDRKPMGMHTVVFPVTWRAEEATGLFPELEGQFEVAAMSVRPPLCQLTFTGRYEPPLGGVGAVVDASVGRHIAEAAIHHLVQDLSRRLQKALAVA